VSAEWVAGTATAHQASCAVYRLMPIRFGISLIAPASCASPIASAPHWPEGYVVAACRGIPSKFPCQGRSHWIRNNWCLPVDEAHRSVHTRPGPISQPKRYTSLHPFVAFPKIPRQTAHHGTEEDVPFHSANVIIGSGER